MNGTSTTLFSCLAPLLAGFGMVLSGSPGTAFGETARPNIVMVVVDDLGWADLGCYGNRFHETPHVDRLAREGVRFTDFYAAPVCSPTRASIQSGQATARIGITNFIPGHWRPFEKLVEPPIENAMPLETFTVAEALRGAGYVTGHFGKWHLGGRDYFPDKQGYDVAIVPGMRHFGAKLHTPPFTKLSPDTYLADYLTDEAMTFIEKNRSRPFFVHLAHFAVHIPLEAKKETIAKYRNQPKPGNGIHNPVYAAMVEHVDQNLGRLLEKIDSLELTDKTMVVFVSDNGGLRRRYDGKGELVTSNRPLRDEKGSLYEGGIRVPLVIRLPGMARPGRISAEPVTCEDFYPTLVELAGSRLPAEIPLDGKSLLPLLRGEETLGREAIYFHYPHYHHSTPAGAIREGPWKLVEFFDDGHLELYNLEDDLGEITNLAEKMPDRAQELQAKLAAWRESVGARMPKKNPKYDPARCGQWWGRRSGKPLSTK